MKHPSLIFFLAASMISTTALATFNYEYGADEYVTISNGISPNGKVAITTHGEGEYGYDKFHVYLFAADTGKKIGPLEEVVEPLDTGAGAFGARWSKDSSEVTIVYRVDRHAPLKAITYHLAKGRAIPATKSPVDIPANGELTRFWGEWCSNSKPPVRVFGTPKRH